MNNIQKAIIFYFSGTGNAKRIALWFSEFAVKNRIDCEIFDIAKCDINNITFIDNALILIISPIHGFNFPKITLDFIRHFPRGNNRVVLMNTRAGMKIGKFVTPGLTGIAFMVSSLILRNKCYKIVGQIPFDMPSNWLSIHPSLNEKTVKYLHRINYSRVEKHSVKIFSGQRDFFAYRDLIQDILISPIALGYFFIGRFALAKSFYASSDCDSCGLCIKQCPVQAIKMVNKHPFWTFRCESCMHCMNNCPKRAIETAHGLIVIVSILSSFVLTLLLQSVLQLEIKSSFIRLTIGSVIFIVILWILYYIQHLLMKFRIMSKLVSLTSLTHYKFWGRYKSIPDKRWKE
ncbi:MAG: EFR1 family ferrodoxin [Bacteroidales bacterium]|nr:EFR1 family ferrodoxin [Bacteroidales bacterium]